MVVDRLVPSAANPVVSEVIDTAACLKSSFLRGSAYRFA